MPIVPSRSQRIQDLLCRLSSASGKERDSAVARLTLVGARAVEPLIAFLPTAAPSARRAALEVLDRLGDGRALPAILARVHDAEETVALRALELAGSHPDPRALPALAEVLEGAGSPARRREAAKGLARLQASGLVDALDPLVRRLVDETEEEPLRLAILDALAALEPPLAASTLRPLLRRLRRSAGPVLAARAVSLARALDGGPPAIDTVDELLGRLPASPLASSEAERIGRALSQARVAPLERLHEALDAAREPNAVRVLASALADTGQPASISVLHRALGRLGPIRPQAGSPDDESRLHARLDLHRALAALGSRIALFDLRDSIEARPRTLMAALLGVAARIGDGSLVPSLARAASEDPTLLRPCADAFAAIARRTKLRRTSAALRAVRSGHGAALAAFWERTRGRRPR
jgi:HEAT repeat protein